MLAFASLGTQWNFGMGGPIGLRYEALPLVLRVRGVPRAEWPDVFDGIRIMEGEALKVMNRKRNG